MKSLSLLGVGGSRFNSHFAQIVCPSLHHFPAILEEGSAVIGPAVCIAYRFQPGACEARARPGFTGITFSPASQ